MAPRTAALLLLLAGFVAADTTYLARADMRGSMLTRKLATDGLCDEEQDACLADDSCLACDAAWDAARSSCGWADGEEILCSDVEEAVCCALEEEEDCDSTFVNLIECQIDAQSSCVGINLDECGAAGLFSSRVVLSAAGSAAVAGLLAAVSGFVV